MPQSHPSIPNTVMPSLNHVMVTRLAHPLEEVGAGVVVSSGEGGKQECWICVFSEPVG